VAVSGKELSHVVVAVPNKGVENGARIKSKARLNLPDWGVA
jgi:hypothetical protein